jgi:hypothetical protein
MSQKWYVKAMTALMRLLQRLPGRT